ncbi:hypothetical protein [Rhodococcus sp. IEGM 1408]|uniref:hypothetical protein n=1 Tax=Rhodococcus sp. IEGM 1408 TaxID=3082220 RepID=UPI0029543AB1|nr:hypothetical protein [Rhodococcus sp. IEGM 1408]MDV8001453.1 hypothetical protein [Rhodococcus sp. IEGM 1408]
MADTRKANPPTRRTTPRRRKNDASEGVTIDQALKDDMQLNLVTPSGQPVLASSGRQLEVPARIVEQNLGSRKPESTPQDQAAAVMATLLSDLGLSLEDATSLADHVRAHMKRSTSSRTAPVSQSDLDYLRDHAGLSDPSTLDDWRPEAEDKLRAEIAVANAAQFILDTLSRDEAAHLLNRDRTVVSRRVSNGQLLAVQRDGRPRFPSWQFYKGEALPGMSEIIGALTSAEMDTVSLGNFMTLPNDELDGLSPVDYLVGGGDPEVIAALLDAVARS